MQITTRTIKTISYQDARFSHLEITRYSQYDNYARLDYIECGDDGYPDKTICSLLLETGETDDNIINNIEVYFKRAVNAKTDELEKEIRHYQNLLYFTNKRNK